MEYRIEDCKLYNERKNASLPIIGDYIYKMESLPREEKIKFIDEYYEKNGNKGACTYMLNLINKYLEEKDNLPKDNWGYVKTISLKAWLKRNDPWKIVDDHYHYGSYYFANREYSNFATLTPRPTWSSNVPYYDEEGKIVDLWFHDVLNILYYEEERYFFDHDPLILKIRKIEEYGRLYGSFGIKKIDMIASNGVKVLDSDWRRTFHCSLITKEEIDEMIKVYEDFDRIAKAKIKEIQINLGWEVYED